MSDANRLLSRTLASLGRDELVVPFLERAILKQDWPEEYEIKVHNKERVWDGMFHPSTDLASDELFLYYKFAFHEDLVEERVSPEGVLAMQIGSAVHSMLQSLLIHLGFTERQWVEYKFVDKQARVSGAVDVLKVFTPARPNGIALDIKTCSYLPDKISAEYEMQGIGYSDYATDEPLDEFLLLFIEKSYPHRMRELLLTRNADMEAKSKALSEKLQRVRDAVDAKDPTGLKFCCNPGSTVHRSCPARLVCRVGELHAPGP